MADATRLTGGDNIIANLNKRLAGIEGNTHKGMQRAGLMIKRKAQEQTPVVSGTLKGSAFVQTEETPSGVSQRIGYTADYAPKVHELPATRSGTPQFLLKAIMRNVRRYLDIVAKAAKL